MNDRRKPKNPLRWEEVTVYKGTHSDKGLLPAVRLTYTVLSRGKVVLFSHTPGVVHEEDEREGFIPVMHLRDVFMAQYLPLLEQSARVAARIRVRYDEQSGRERLATSVASILLAKEKGENL